MDYDELVQRLRKYDSVSGYSKQTHAAADAIVQLQTRVAELDETWTDELGTVWKSPTAWAYAMTCRARQAQQERAERAEADLAAERADAERYRWLRSIDSYNEWNRCGHYAGDALDAAIDSALAGKDAK